MKKNILYAKKNLLLFALFLLTSVSLSAQTTLALGDIAFTGYNCDNLANSDEFTFVVLKSTGINSGTTIYFTDRGWKGGSCGTDNFCTASDYTTCSGTENGSHFVWTSGSFLSYGTHVKISAGTPTPCSTCFTCSNGSASGTYLNLLNTGDQIFATQNGASTTTISNGGSGTMLAAIQANVENTAGCTFSTTNWDDCTSAPCTDVCGSANNSNKPTCLTTGTNCLILYNTATTLEVDNGVYNCTSSNSGTSGAAITAMRTAINNIANWTLNDAAVVTIPPAGCSPLPVTWVHFIAQLNNNGGVLEWSTSSERNSSHFEIERSFDGIEWKNVGIVNGAGNKYSTSNYYYEDFFNTDDVKFVYYRIRQVDFDGRYEYTPMRVAGKPEQTTGYTAFAFNGNPLTEATYLKTFLPTQGDAHIEISDTRGNILFSKTFQYNGGHNRFMFNNEVPEIMKKAGVYFVKASIEGEEKIFKLVVQ